MSNDTQFIHNVELDEITIIELTDEQQAARDAEVAANLAAKETAKAEAAQLRATKVSAYEKLGLTDAEIAAILPPLED